MGVERGCSHWSKKNINNGIEKLEFMDTEISENWRERPQATSLSSSPIILPVKM